MTQTELNELRTTVDTAYVEKTGKQPYSGARLMLYGDLWDCFLWTKNCTENDYQLSAEGQTPVEAIEALKEVIAALPSADEANMREFQADLGRLIDKGRDFNIPVDFVNPLIATSKALAENAITDQRTL